VEASELLDGVHGSDTQVRQLGSALDA
jgi:hypothetical protein